MSQKKTAHENPGCWLFGLFLSLSTMDSLCRTLVFPFPLFLSLFYTNDVERVFSASTTVSLSQLNAFHCASIINVIIISLARFPSLSFSLLYIARSIYLSIFRCLHYRSLSLSRSRSNETMWLMPTVVNERVRECVCEYSLFLSPVK